MSRAAITLFGILLLCAPLTTVAQQADADTAPIQLAGQRIELAPRDLRHRQQPPLSCGFCTLPRRLRHADLAIIVERTGKVGGEHPMGLAVVVRSVIKRGIGVTVDLADTLELPRSEDDKRQDHALVICAKDGSGRVGVTEVEWISEAGASYYAELASVASRLARVEFLLRSEASDDSFVSANAFAELSAIPASDLHEIAGKLSRNIVVRRLAQADLSSPRRNLYLQLLGCVGDATDVPTVEDFVFTADGDKLASLASAAEAYLRLGGHHAGRKVVQRYFSSPMESDPVQLLVGDELSLRLRQQFAVYQAIRRLRDEPEMEATYGQVGSYLVNHSCLGDIVLGDALQARDDRFIEVAMSSYQRRIATDSVRVEILAYIIVMHEQAQSEAMKKRLMRFLAEAFDREPQLYEQARQRRRLRRPR